MCCGYRGSLENDCFDVACDGTQESSRGRRKRREEKKEIGRNNADTAREKRVRSKCRDPRFDGGYQEGAGFRYACVCAFVRFARKGVDYRKAWAAAYPETVR